MSRRIETTVALVGLLAAGSAAPGLGAQPAAPFRAYADSLLSDPLWRSTLWGVLVIDPLTGDTLYSRNAGKLFMPASNQKLITGAVALQVLGPAFRFETRVMGAAQPIEGILTGDLAIVANGDPFSGDSVPPNDAMAPLRALADAIAARGITDITGRLIRGADTFPDSALGFGWAWDDLHEGYAAPVDELMFNEGFARISIIGASRPGGQVTVSTAPARTIPRLGTIDVVTSPCCAERSRVQWGIDVRGTRPVVHLRGTVRARDTVRVNVALRDPAGAWLDALLEALGDRGIRVRGGTESRLLADTAGMVTLATHHSPPLPEVLVNLQKDSQNQIAELLYKTLGRVVTGTGTADSARRAIERQLVAWGADSAGFAIRDGSGLSRHDYLTPETIIRVLDTMRRHPDFDAYYRSLPIGGIDGTIRNRLRGSAGEGNVRAKTGTLDKVRSLSGYVTTADGRLLLFSLMTNNFVAPGREVDRVQDALVDWLAASRR